MLIALLLITADGNGTLMPSSSNNTDDARPYRREAHRRSTFTSAAYRRHMLITSPFRAMSPV